MATYTGVQFFRGHSVERYNNFFASGDNQFGFKKQSSCSHAIYSLRCVVDSYVKNGTTVNICAFDKTNHYGLFVRLMQKSFVYFRKVVFDLYYL